MKRQNFIIILFFSTIFCFGQNNDFVIGAKALRHSWTSNNKIYKKRLRSTDQTYSSNLGVLSEDGLELIRVYMPGNSMRVYDLKRLIELADNNNMKIIDMNRYFTKVPPSSNIDGIIDSNDYQDLTKVYNVYNMDSIDPDTVNHHAIYNYDLLYDSVYSRKPWKDIIYGHMLTEESSHYHGQPHANIFPPIWPDTDPAIRHIVKQYYTFSEIPPTHLFLALGHFHQRSQQLGHKLINNQARHGGCITYGDTEGVFNATQYLSSLHFEGDIFYEGSYFSNHWEIWTRDSIPYTGINYLGKFESIDYANKQIFGIPQLFSEIQCEYFPCPLDPKYHWHTNLGITNANTLWFYTYGSIIHGATGIILYGPDKAYDDQDNDDVINKSLHTDTNIYDNFGYQYFSKFYKGYISKLIQQLRYLKEKNLLSTDPSSVLYTKTTDSDIGVNDVMPASTSYLPVSLSGNDIRDVYTIKGDSPSKIYPNNHRSEYYGLRYTVRTNGNEVIMIIMNPNPYALHNIPIDFNSLSNSTIQSTTSVDVLFEDQQSVTSTSYKTDREWVDRDLFIANITADGLITKNVDAVTCAMRYYNIPYLSSSNKSINLSFGPLDVKILKFKKDEIVLTNTIWNTDKFCDYDIYVKNGATLTISSVLSMQKGRKIVVEKGGKLILDGGTISCSCGLWQGILVQGDEYYNQDDETKQGVLIVKNNSTISNAETAVYVGKYLVSNSQSSESGNYGNGIIKIKDSEFLNNQKDIVMRPNVKSLIGPGQTSLSPGVMFITILSKAIQI
jgi:hypothetical protein